MTPRHREPVKRLHGQGCARSCTVPRESGFVNKQNDQISNVLVRAESTAAPKFATGIRINISSIITASIFRSIDGVTRETRGLIHAVIGTEIALVSGDLAEADIEGSRQVQLRAEQCKTVGLGLMGSMSRFTAVVVALAA